MQNKTDIICNVNSCVFQKDQHCKAETITVACDNCIMPNESHETKCHSFRCKTEK